MLDPTTALGNPPKELDEYGSVQFYMEIDSENLRKSGIILRNTKKEEITTILLPCKPVLDVYTQPASVYPKDFDGGYLPVERSVKKTLLDKLNEMEVMGMDADSRKLFKQINLDDFNWIISQTIDFDSEFKKELDKGQDLTWKGYEHPESLALESMLWSTKGIEEIWVIGKGRIRKIVLHK